jgi:hypothetical protein
VRLAAATVYSLIRKVQAATISRSRRENKTSTRDFLAHLMLRERKRAGEESYEKT